MIRSPGIASLVVSILGRSEVHDNPREQIEGTPDMTPEGQESAQAAGIDTSDLPTCSVAGELVDTGSEAKRRRLHARARARGNRRAAFDARWGAT